ncbi:hypothetical protein FRC0421_01792 [Corynebacterium diphtheriae]|nr:hypothetical protein FRC0209_01837 [Corynebacterium diphtheriae]CAB0841230.1 hypothetical protein FRC0323_01000 [Corynebacterium diphtheriae]CAB0913436.1 hypothetical protein FRC0421_01792 [Corynebacterium diphtheriae]
MIMPVSLTRFTVGVVLFASVTALVACSSDKSDTPNVAVTTTFESAAEFKEKNVSPVKVEFINAPEKDPGLNVEWQIQGTGYNNEGSGAVIYVRMKNLNDVAIPADAFDDPVLTINGTEASRVEAGTVDLDLPLGPGATTNLQFAFDTGYGSLSDAKLVLGNCIFEGNLSNI